MFSFPHIKETSYDLNNNVFLALAERPVGHGGVALEGRLDLLLVIPANQILTNVHNIFPHRREPKVTTEDQDCLAYPHSTRPDLTFAGSGSRKPRRRASYSKPLSPSVMRFARHVRPVCFLSWLSFICSLLRLTAWLLQTCCLSRIVCKVYKPSWTFARNSRLGVITWRCRSGGWMAFGKSLIDTPRRRFCQFLMLRLNCVASLFGLSPFGCGTGVRHLRSFQIALNGLAKLAMGIETD